ncbi:MAG TPA: cytochrome c [Burkholderiaceae bacterium]|nr:cytochrome c [Burkholderiaceae bacterium]
MDKWLCRKILIAGILFSTCINVHSASEPEKSRGELLYSTHCIACHTTHVHWRDQRLATDLHGLAKQVRRWQSNTGLGWNDEDIAAVTAHLNALYYHFPPTSEEKAVSLKQEKKR